MKLFKRSDVLSAVQIILLSIVCLCASVLAAQNSTPPTNGSEVLIPSDFAYGIEITPKDQNILQVILLPDFFYENIAGENYADMRVFNKDSESLPFALHSSDSAISEDIQTPMDIFPIFGTSDTDISNLNIQLNRSTNSGIQSLNQDSIRIQLDDQTDRTEPQQIVAYILDASKASETLATSSSNTDSKAINSLKFDWTQPEQGIISNILIEASDDLKSWSTLVRGAQLSRLIFNGETLEQTNIELPDTKARYLRISWPKKYPGLAFDEVMANTETTTVTRSLTWQEYEDASLVPNAEINSLEQGAYFLETSARFPTSAIELEAQENTFYKGTFYSRSNETKAWIKRGSFSQYNLVTAEGSAVSAPHEIRPQNDSQWLFKFDYPAPLSSNRTPKIRLGWQPHELTLMAQGTGPYTLAFGNPNILPAPTEFRRIIGDLSDQFSNPSGANHSGLQNLGGSSKLEQDQPTSSLPILLWGILILGVAIMAIMVVGLLKQMRQTQ